MCCPSIFLLTRPFRACCWSCSASWRPLRHCDAALSPFSEATQGDRQPDRGAPQTLLPQSPGDPWTPAQLQHLIRHVNFHLLQVARPEFVFVMRRHRSR